MNKAKNELLLATLHASCEKTKSDYDGDDFRECQKGHAAKPAGSGSIPKPIPYDYMPEGYPKKEVGEVTLFDQTVTTNEKGTCFGSPNFISLTAGKTYFVYVNGAKYECVCYNVFDSFPVLGNAALMGTEGGNGEPFFILPAEGGATFENAANMYIALKITEVAEVVTPMDENMVPPMTPIYISQEEVDGTVTYKADIPFVNAYALPVGTLASRLVYGYDESWKEGGLGTSCLTVTKAATRSRGQNIVMVFSVSTAMSDNTCSVEELTFVWTDYGIELLTATEVT